MVMEGTIFAILVLIMGLELFLIYMLNKKLKRVDETAVKADVELFRLIAGVAKTLKDMDERLKVLEEDDK